MLINSLNEMETVVENNESLSWDGWDVLHLTKSPTGWMKPDGVFRNGNWFIQKRYDITEQGWDLPAKLVKKYAK